MAGIKSMNKLDIMVQISFYCKTSLSKLKKLTRKELINLYYKVEGGAKR